MLSRILRDLKIYFALVLVLAPLGARAQEEGPTAFGNLPGIISRQNFSLYYNFMPYRKVKIGICDEDFSGYKSSLGLTLPSEVRYVDGPKKPQFAKRSFHGRVMAELVYLLMTNLGQSQQLAPQFNFYRCEQYSNFKYAIDDAIENGVQIMLWSQVQDYGNNFDGGGFWNKEINRAISHGIVWVNAAGNFAKTTYTSGINFGGGGEVILPGQNSTVAVKCSPDTRLAQSCGRVTIVLNWTDYKGEVDSGTTKDLDLFVLDSKFQPLVVNDENGKAVQAISARKQVLDASKADGVSTSNYPVERVIIPEMKEGTYYVKVKSKDPSQFTRRDQLRVAADGMFLSLTPHNPLESVHNPADNKDVATVGAFDVDRSSLSYSLGKPELIAPSLIMVNNIKAPTSDNPSNVTSILMGGSSISAAIVTAGWGLLTELWNFDYFKFNLTAPELLGYTSNPMPGIRFPVEPRTAHLGFKGSGLEGCFKPLDSGLLKKQRPGLVFSRDLLESTRQSGMAILTETETRELKILVRGDPRTFYPTFNYPKPGQVFMDVTQNLGGPHLVEAANSKNFGNEGIELFQWTVDTPICGEIRRPPGGVSKMGSMFNMPPLD